MQQKEKQNEENLVLLNCCELRGPQSEEITAEKDNSSVLVMCWNRWNWYKRVFSVYIRHLRKCAQTDIICGCQVSVIWFLQVLDGFLCRSDILQYWLMNEMGSGRTYKHQQRHKQPQEQFLWDQTGRQRSSWLEYTQLWMSAKATVWCGRSSTGAPGAF